MPKIPEPQHQWYVVHVLSGKEQQVHRRILRNLEAEEMGDKVFEVLMPTELVSEVRGGKKSERKKKFYPGYIIVNMNLLNQDGSLVDETWYFIKETDGVIGFAGTKDKPLSRTYLRQALLSPEAPRRRSLLPPLHVQVRNGLLSAFLIGHLRLYSCKHK